MCLEWQCSHECTFYFISAYWESFCSSIDLSSQTKSQGQGLTYTFQKHFSALNPPQQWQCLALSFPLPRCCLTGLASLRLHHCLPKWLHIFCILITQLYGKKSELTTLQGDFCCYRSSWCLDELSVIQSPSNARKNRHIKSLQLNIKSQHHSASASHVLPPFLNFTG